ncbi:hypothetical protein ACPCG0_08120 [Propionibacteriaceae bacterium Y1923]|uniref:hypothetical protein n=1 Tax=Aestuariimicrobium sp. Y1814 TaxID=3418742 RepID=UPI003C1D0BA8
MSSNPYNDHAGTTDATHRYSGGTSPTPGGYGSYPGATGTTGTSTGGQGTTTWQLGEFETHMGRLSRVHESVLATNQKTSDAVQNTGEAYGMLFGWAIMPFLNRIADATVDFTDKLAGAVENSRQAMRMTMAAYNDRESANAASTLKINSDNPGSYR